MVGSLSEPSSSNPCDLQGYILRSNPFCIPYTHHFLHQHNCVVFMKTPLVQVSGDTELWVRVCWSAHGLYPTQLRWNCSWFTLVQKNLERGPRTTGLCPNRPLHKVNHKKSVLSASNLLNKLLQFTVIRSISATPTSPMSDQFRIAFPRKKIKITINIKSLFLDFWKAT